MDIKYLSFVAILSVGLIGCGDGNKETETVDKPEAVSEESSEESAGSIYNVDASSTVKWKGTMVGMYSHEGEMSVKEGSVTLAGGTITAGTFIIDAASNHTTDDDALYAMSPRENLEGHLKSGDFLDVGANPTASFTIKSVNGDAITGDMTIKGNTFEETILGVTVSEDGGKLSATGTMTFERTKYGLTYQMEQVEMVLDNNVELTINITGSAQ